MYESFCGFKEKPFQIVPNPDYLYKNPKHLKIPKNLLAKIKNLKDDVQNIQLQLAIRLNQLLEDERMRNAKLLRKCIRLKMRYEALRRIRKRLEEERYKSLASNESPAQPSQNNPG